MPHNIHGEPSAETSPYGGDSITLAAHVVELLPHGGRRVRLSNMHEMDVLRVRGRETEVSLIGDIVTIGLAPGAVHGWRLI